MPRAIPARLNPITGDIPVPIPSSNFPLLTGCIVRQEASPSRQKSKFILILFNKTVKPWSPATKLFFFETYPLNIS